MRAIFAALAGAALAAGCGGASDAPDAEAAPAVSAQRYVVETVATGLSFPWGIAFLPDGGLLITQRDGPITLAAGGAAQSVSGGPQPYVENQGGLFDVALHPNFAENRLVYLSYAAGTEAANATEVARARLEGTQLVGLERIFRASPDKPGGAHFGGRLLFLPDGTLLLSLGDGYIRRNEAQDRTTHFGAIVRMTETGAPAPDNPFFAEGGAAAYVYTFGHRNVQGLARDPASGRLYAHEHGPRGGDEVNVLTPGANYGWPVATYGVDYSGASISPFTERAGMAAPLLHWTPSIAPSGLALYDGSLFPEWRGDLFVSTLAGSHLRRVDLGPDGAPLGQETLLAERGARLRHVAQGPDGALYVLTDSPEGEVLRISPAPGA